MEGLKKLETKEKANDDNIACAAASASPSPPLFSLGFLNK